jgi:hypothetical protein
LKEGINDAALLIDLDRVNRCVRPLKCVFFPCALEGVRQLCNPVVENVRESHQHGQVETFSANGVHNVGQHNLAVPGSREGVTMTCPFSLISK